MWQSSVLHLVPRIIFSLSTCGAADLGKFSYLHHSEGIPEDGVVVKIQSRVEPEMKLLLSITFTLGNNISMNSVRFTTEIPQEFKVYLIP